MTDHPQEKIALPLPGTRMTAAEFLALPETTTRMELIDGVVIYPFGFIEEGEDIMSPAPTLDHQELVLRMRDLIKSLVDGGRVYVAPVDVYLTDEIVVQPDVVWVAEGSACRAVDGKYLAGPPDLIVEVLSPGTARRDRSEKLALYERYGVLEYWIADKERRTLDVYQRQGDKFVKLGTFHDGDTFTSSAIGKPVNLAGVFEGLV